MYHSDILDSIQDLKANWQALSGVEKIQRARDILSERELQEKPIRHNKKVKFDWVYNGVKQVDNEVNSYLEYKDFKILTPTTSGRMNLAIILDKDNNFVSYKNGRGNDGAVQNAVNFINSGNTEEAKKYYQKYFKTEEMPDISQEIKDNPYYDEKRTMQAREMLKSMTGVRSDWQERNKQLGDERMKWLEEKKKKDEEDYQAFLKELALESQPQGAESGVSGNNSSIDTSTPLASEKEYHYNKAQDAFQHTSRNAPFAYRENFVKDINSNYNRLNVNLNPEQQAYLDKEFIDLKSEYLKHELPIFSAQGSMVSSHIAGRDKFKTSLATRGESSRDKAVSDFSKWFNGRIIDIEFGLSRLRNNEQIQADKDEAKQKALKKAKNSVLNTLAAFNERGWDKSSLVKSAKKAIEELKAIDEIEAKNYLLKINDAYVNDGRSLAQVIGTRTDLWKDLAVFLGLGATDTKNKTVSNSPKNRPVPQDANPDDWVIMTSEQWSKAHKDSKAIYGDTRHIMRGGEMKPVFLSDKKPYLEDITYDDLLERAKKALSPELASVSRLHYDALKEKIEMIEDGSVYTNKYTKDDTAKDFYEQIVTAENKAKKPILDTSNIIGWFDNTDDGMILDEVSTQSLKALFQTETNGMAKIALARKILQIRNDNEINMSFEEMAEKLADKYGFKKDDMDDAKRSYGYKDSYSLSFREDEVTTRFFKIGSSNDGKLLYFETSGVFSNYHLIYPKQESFSSYQEADNYIAQVLKDFGVINAQHISSNMESDSQTPENADSGNEKTVFNDRDTAGQGVGITGANTSEEWNREQGNTGIPTDSTAIDGTQSDSSVVSGNGQYRADSRDSDSTGSDQLSEDGIQADRATNPTVEADARQSERLDLATKTRLQLEAESLDSVFNDEASIRATLPFLLHEQQTDIVKIEKRLANANGMMITNSTGTGKTYTALGAVKRFAKMGKNSILIVTPRDKIIQDFIDSGKNLHLDIKQLDSIRDNGGNGIAVTTYANFQQNQTLLKRNWDLVIFDESHYLNSAQDGKATEAQNMMRALTGHKRGLYERAVRLAMLETGVNIVAVREKIKKHEAKDAPIEDKLSPEELAKLRQDELIFLEKVTPLYDEIKANPPQKSKVIFLSATPFAYDKSIDYAEGFLFDYPDVDGSGYNSGGGYERFMMQHFGYTMKYNRLTSPDVEVNSGAMQRQFNQMLQDKGALSGRALKVEADFSRQFIVLKDRIGEQLDEAFAALRDSGMHELSGFIQRTTFDYLAQQRLLEAIKAKAVIPRIKKHLALGRKVVLFHSYVTETEIRHPFYLDKNHKEWKTIGNDDIKQKLESQLIAFKAKYPKYANMKLDNLAGPIETLKKAFGSDLMVYNGKVPPKLILKNAQEFNDDNKSKDIILMQVDKGKEGVSLHDTTGKKTRVLINLGLPTKPTDSIQIEGRIYRTGQVSNAIFEYISTGTQFEKRAFSETIAKRSSTAENLALGNQARDLLSAFTEGYLNATDEDPHEEQGTGGKQYNEVAELSPYDKAISDYFATQKANKHTKAKGVDYFPTPEPIGLKMVDLAQISAGESALEPSAGHGAIARYFPDYAKSTFIEPSSELTGDLALRTAGNGDIKSMTFEQLNTINKFDAIVMNPPFGKGGSMAIDHLTKAVEHLRDAGRIVALIPNGGMADKRFDKFISEIATPYNVFLRSEIILPSVAFERAGTSVSSRIVVLDRIDDEEQAISVYPTHHDLSGNDDIKDLFNEIKDLIPRDRPKPLTEEIRQARRAAKLQAKAVEKAKKLIDGLDKLKDGVLPALRNKFNMASNRELLIYSVFNDGKLPKIADDKNSSSARRAGGITSIANRIGLKPITDTGALETIAGRIKSDYELVTDEQLAMILEILKRA